MLQKNLMQFLKKMFKLRNVILTVIPNDLGDGGLAE